MTTDKKKLESSSEILSQQLNQSLTVPLSASSNQESLQSRPLTSSMKANTPNSATLPSHGSKPPDPNSSFFFPSTTTNTTPKTTPSFNVGNKLSTASTSNSDNRSEVAPQLDPRTSQLTFDLSQVAFFPKVMNVPSTNTNITYQQSTSGGRGGVLTHSNHPHYHHQHQSTLQSQTTSPLFMVPGTSQPFVTHRGRGTFPVSTMPSRYYYTSPDGTTIQNSTGRGRDESTRQQYDNTSFHVNSAQGSSASRRQPYAHYFMSEALRQELQRRIELLMRGSNPDDFIAKALPRSIHRYHSLFPLEELSKDNISKVFGLRTLVLKSICSSDGQAYVLRKVDTYRLASDYAMQTIETWKQVQHPNVVALKEVFLSPAFDNTQSLYFAYEYIPGAETLEEHFLRDLSKDKIPIPEDTLWSIIIQIISGLKKIHSMGLACRILVPSKILICGVRNRVRINCIGMDDVLNFDARRNVAHSQYEDLVSLGKLILILARRSYNALQNVVKSLEFIGANYSADLKNLVATLLTKPNLAPFPTIDDVISWIGNRILHFSNHLESQTDILETELMKELDNGRLLRLLVKLGFINERPEYDMSSNWSETGDRYLLKLFRDYVFHQVYEDGNPYIDFAHVIDCLNKLDIGSDEKILLSSRDEKYLLVVSYKDIKRLINEAFNELVEKNKQSRLIETNRQFSHSPTPLSSYSSFVSQQQQQPLSTFPKTNN